MTKKSKLDLPKVLSGAPIYESIHIENAGLINKVDRIDIKLGRLIKSLQDLTVQSNQRFDKIERMLKWIVVIEKGVRKDSWLMEDTANNLEKYIDQLPDLSDIIDEK